MSLDKFLKGKAPEDQGAPPATREGEKKDGLEQGGEKDLDGGELKPKIAALRQILGQQARVPAQEPSNPKKSNDAGGDDAFLVALESFATWLCSRTYLRGDAGTAKQMIRNLVIIDPSLAPGHEESEAPAKIPDLRAFLRAVKEHDSLRPKEALLTQEQARALSKRSQGKKLDSTDYRHLRLLKEQVAARERTEKFQAFLVEYFSKDLARK